MLIACVAALKGHYPHIHRSADSLLSCGINDLILCCVDYTVLLKDLLEGMNSVVFINTAHDRLSKTESGIFISCDGHASKGLCIFTEDGVTSTCGGPEMSHPFIYQSAFFLVLWKQ